MAEFLTPDTVLAADATGLWFDGEFLAWNEIMTIGLAATEDRTEPVVRLRHDAPAAEIEPEVRRRLPVHVDLARLTAAVPAGMGTALTAPS